jgi:predicted nucleotidyltransferase
LSLSPQDFLRQRAEETGRRFQQIQSRLDGARAIVSDFATVYATGSFGRGEASSYSDLDAFILSGNSDELSKEAENNLRETLKHAAEKEDLPPFSGDGKYLAPHNLSAMVDKLGGREDDYDNLFTARILLLLESRPLVGEEMYGRAIDRILAEYWKDYEGNEAFFLPIYLTNDIIRYWKVLCLNYEAYSRGSEDRRKRRLDNYKLKHSRLLTCYSGILYLAHLLDQGRPSISAFDAKEMTAFTPLQRMEQIYKESSSQVRSIVDDLRGMYARFLQETNAPKSELLDRFGDEQFHQAHRADSRRFGATVYDLLKALAAKGPLFRYLVV